MRRLLALALLAAASLSSLALAPTEVGGEPTLCVRYRDTDVPGTTITVPTPLPGDRFCVQIVLPDVDA